MPIIEIDATNWGELFKDDAVYATAQGAASGDSVSNNDTEIYLGQGYVDTPLYSLWRGALIFPVQLLPPGATVISAILSIWGKTDDSDTDFNITIVNGSDLADSFVLADYGDLLDEVADYGALTTLGLSLTGYNDITLTAAGIAALQTAVTAGNKIRFGVRSSRDISVTTPKLDGEATYDESIVFHGDVTGKKPKLTITLNEPRKGQAWIEGAYFHFFDEYNTEEVLAAANSIVSNESEIVCHEDNVVYD